MSRTFKRKINTAKEAGLVSIMVTLILMIVISLIVLGFAQISRRNQRQALDRQLSTQAFYAAETGVNDVRDLIKTAVLAGQSIPEKPDCTGGAGAAAAFYAGLNPDLDSTSADEAEYTCVMVDPTPDTLLYGDVGTTSTIVPIISASGGGISRITLTWQTKDDTNTPTTNCPTSTNNVFSSASAWRCGYGVLRTDLVPTNGAFDAATLQTRTMTSFLVPHPNTTGINTFAYTQGSANNRRGIRCNNTNCTLTITGLSVNQYYMRVSSLYKNVSLQVAAFDSSGNQLSLQGAQAVIDSTGKAQDVLRRIQVHVPLLPSSQNRLSDYAIQSTDSICKRFVVMDNYFDTSVSGVTSSNPLCQP